jgi:hypothetical protein
MGAKAGKAFVLILNIVGLICLIDCSIPYLTHDTFVPNPDAMIPFERWEAGGFALTIGALPLLIANALAYAFMGKGKARLFFFLPSVLCVAMAVHFWVSSLAA